jgi:hypothetical protein
MKLPVTVDIISADRAARSRSKWSATMGSSRECPDRRVDSPADG